MSSTVSLISIIPHQSSNQTGDDPGAYSNAEADKSFTFDEQSIRKGFIRKVFLILMCQLLIIYGFVCVFSNSVQQNPALLWITLPITKSVHFGVKDASKILFQISNAFLYASLGVILFSVYLVYDIQLMMDCEHKYSISPEEYIFAALNLYLDIVNLFMYIPNIIGLSRS